MSSRGRVVSQLAHSDSSFRFLGSKTHEEMRDQRLSFLDA